jgi:Xaa-Pro dipeptidase
VLDDLVPAGAVLAVDELTGAMRRAQPRLFPSGRPADAAQIVGAAKLIKTPDELACIRTACRITDEAIVDVQAALAPGIRQIDLSAGFMRRAFELGAMASMLEPIWQVMPPSKEDGVWTTHGDLALPLLTTERELRAGDVLWTDVSITYAGYCSDFGRTWLVGQDPTPRQQAQFGKWREIMDAVLDVTRAGATAAELGRAATKANGGARPWLPHFYLGHGIGVNAAEMPMIGTDLGDEFDENFVFEPGMVVVLEPVVWEDGTGGYRSEEIVVITEEGWIPLTDYPYHPYGN